jgi:hypothetical protein
MTDDQLSLILFDYLPMHLNFGIGNFFYLFCSFAKVPESVELEFRMLNGPYLPHVEVHSGKLD